MLSSLPFPVSCRDGAWVCLVARAFRLLHISVTANEKNRRFKKRAGMKKSFLFSREGDNFYKQVKGALPLSYFLWVETIFEVLVGVIFSHSDISRLSDTLN